MTGNRTALILDNVVNNPFNTGTACLGYPWTVVRVEDQDAYLSALDAASIDLDIGPFAGFIAERVRWSLEQTGNPRKRAGP